MDLRIVVAVFAILMLTSIQISQSIILRTTVLVRRNFGLSKARGEFIYFVDSDDYLVGNLFAEFEDKLVLDLDLAVFSYYDSFEEDLTEKQRTEKSLPFKGNYDKGWFYQDI